MPFPHYSPAASSLCLPCSQDHQDLPKVQFLPVNGRLIHCVPVSRFSALYTLVPSAVDWCVIPPIKTVTMLFVGKGINTEIVIFHIKGRQFQPQRITNWAHKLPLQSSPPACLLSWWSHISSYLLMMKVTVGLCFPPHNYPIVLSIPATNTTLRPLSSLVWQLQDQFPCACFQPFYPQTHLPSVPSPV